MPSRNCNEPRAWCQQLKQNMLELGLLVPSAVMPALLPRLDRLLQSLASALPHAAPDPLPSTDH